MKISGAPPSLRAMETLSVRCNHCGAPLEIANKTRFVTCQFCNSNLEVKRTESSVFTEEVAQIAENTGKMAESLEAIALENEIERLDREWGIERADEFIGGRQGRPPAAPVLGMAFAIFFALVCFGMASFSSSFGAPGIFQLVPIGMGLFALVSGMIGVTKGRQRESARAQHEQRRAEVLSRLNALKQK